MPPNIITADTGMIRRFDVRKRTLTAVANGKKLLTTLNNKLQTNNIKPTLPHADRKIIPQVGKCWTIAKTTPRMGKQKILALKPTGAWIIYETTTKNNTPKIVRTEKITVSDAAQFIHHIKPETLETHEWETIIEKIAVEGETLEK